MKQSLPNFLTYLRIAMIPLLFVVFYYTQGPLSAWLCAGIFFVAGITDFIDGYLARKWNVVSSVGRFLDPIADKLLVAACLVMLVDAGRADVIPAILILCREILVSGLREFLAEIQVSVPVSTLAKYKTAAQMLAIFLLLLAPGAPFVWQLHMVGNYLLWAAAILTLITGLAYLKTGAKHLAK